MALITSTVSDLGTRAIVTKKAVQENLYSHSVAMLFSEVDTSTMGVYRAPLTAMARSPISQMLTATNDDYVASRTTTNADVLQIDRKAEFAERVGAFDEASFSNGSLIRDRVKNATSVMAQTIDRFVINKAITDAATSIGNSGVVGSTTPWTVSANNAMEIVNRVVREVNFNEGYGDAKFIVVDSAYAQFLTGYFQATGNNVADERILKGIPYLGTIAGGVRVFQTNNVPTTAGITVGGQPTAGQTFTIQVGGGVVTYTFRASAVTAAAGDVLIGGSAAATQANLLSAIQNPGTTNANHVALAEEERSLLTNLRVTAASVSTTVNISAEADFRLGGTAITGPVVLVAPSRRLLAGAMNAVKVFVPTKGMSYKEKDGIGGFDGTEVHMRQFFNSMTETRKKPLTTSVLVN
jgi:hypothetical protein